MVTETSLTHDIQNSQPLRVEEAQQQILDAIETPDRDELVPLRLALGRVLSKSVTTLRSIPEFRNSAMDGYAICVTDLTQSNEFIVVGESLAGHPYVGEMKSQQCVLITTGAMLPAEADSVVMQENITLNNNAISINSHVKLGEYVRQPGNEFQSGEILFTVGQRIEAADLGLLAAQGIAEVSVYQRPRVAFFSTGDELQTVGSKLKPGQIYDSNRYTLLGLLQELGVIAIDLGRVADDKLALTAVFERAKQCADLVISSGGVSVGKADYIKDILQQHGQVKFWKIAMRPGKPLTFGRLNQACFIGLPGNPVSVLVTFALFVKPAIAKFEGQQHKKLANLKLKCMSELKKAKGRRDYQRGVIYTNENGELEVCSTGAQDSHRLSSMSKANCYILVAESCAEVKIGEYVEVIPFANAWQ